MTTLKQISKETEKIISQLDEENATFVNDLALHLATLATFKDKLTLELKINEIANDIANAQANGISAEKFFGNQPKVATKELLKALPKKSNWQFIKENTILTSILLIYSLPIATLYTRQINGQTHLYLCCPLIDYLPHFHSNSLFHPQ
ncbi:hypothetical protein Hs30E_06700 [Lactococcus hodotermopsidis]|uniref:Uncharacterized protein n=1 Tax=Pseudolactococcus hodotermopsidis TaxID=2709157 RepID=A0A6A0B9J8_9LACT|nr:hypothetical protein [Lactococcus hodotermopsidis]GFH42119.1 hypothetical protein Hs30E_06700 [Lactococcus hodotermopsidis]